MHQFRVTLERMRARCLSLLGETFAGATPARIAHLLAPTIQKKGLLVTSHLRLSRHVTSFRPVGQGWLERGSLHAFAQTLGAKSRIANRARDVWVVCFGPARGERANGVLEIVPSWTMEANASQPFGAFSHVFKTWGEPHGAAATIDGATFPQARRDKAGAYPELVQDSSCHKFIVLGSEVGGRFSHECVDLVRQLINNKAQHLGDIDTKAFRLIYARRWWGILSVAVQRAVASNLLGGNWMPSIPLSPPSMEELLCATVVPPATSRMR